MARLLAAVALIVALIGGDVPPALAEPPELTADTAVLWDAQDDRVLWGKDQREPVRPASTTKIMTILLALEAGTLEDTVTVSAVADAADARAGAATLGLRAGQRIPMRSLLEGLALRSGNDAAVAVAEHVAGSQAAFVEKMNARAAELGMRDTNFINASGLTDDLDHHASALDLARLADTAMANEDFASWAGAVTLTVESLGVLTNRNELLTRYPGATGVKTGYTNLAGLCLVASARRDGRSLISVVLGADDGAADRHFTESAAVLDHGFDDFRRARPVAADQPLLRYRWSDAKVDVEAEQPLAWTVAATARPRWSVSVAPSLPRPVAAGDPIGRAELRVGGKVVDSTPVVAAADVPASAPRNGADGAGAALQDALRAFARMHVADRDA